MALENAPAMRKLAADHSKLYMEARENLARSEAEERELTDEEKARDDELRASMDALELEMHRERARSADVGSGRSPLPLVGHDGAQVGATPRGRTYESLFGPPAPMAWASGEEFFSAVHLGRSDPRLFAIANEGIPSEGGFSVPEPLFAGMLDASLETEIVRPRADVSPMTSASKRIWGWDASDSSSTLYGGFSGQWVPEGGTITAETPTLRRIELVARKLALLTQVSNELAADGTSYGEQLEAAMTKAISWFLDYAFLRGTGAGLPLGVLNDPALVVISKEAGQAADTILYQNLTDMMTRLHPACVNNAVWVANANTRAQLLELSILVGAGGAFIPALTESGGRFRLLTLPVFFSEKLPVLGDEGDILLADFSQYAIGLRKAMSIDRSGHAGFTSDTTYYRGLLRADGQGKWGSAYTPKNGASLSWCVALEERT